MELKELETELNVLGEFMANILVAEIVAKKKVASGQLRDSVEYKVVRTPNSYAVELYADAYINNVDQGRKPGFPSGGDGSFLLALIEWVKIKGLETDQKRVRSAAWAIRNAIFKRGIPPTNLIKFAIEEIEKQIDSKVREAINQDIENYFDNLILN